jgi:predicted nuclease of restriction endonuclease-like (RecB) superfamily
MSETALKQLTNLFHDTHARLSQMAARSINTSLVVRNWLYGWYIVEFEQGAASRQELYGKALIDQLAKSLATREIKGISPTNLRKFRQFYLAFPATDAIQQALSVEWLAIAPTQIQQTPSVESSKQPCEPLPSKAPPDKQQQLYALLAAQFQLGWSHYVELLTLDDHDERRFYEIEARANSWSLRELQRQISSSLYQRLALSRNPEEIKRLAEQGLVVEQAADIIKNPVVLEFLGLQEKPTYSEEEFESAIIDKLEHFLLELGKGFLFEARQKRFSFDNDHFYVDLVFYNRLLRCYVLIDLKRDKLTHQDLGQMQMYVNYFDQYVKTEHEASTIGIVLCHRKNDALVELTLPKDANIYASNYQFYLPSKEELKHQLTRWVEEQNG